MNPNPEEERSQSPLDQALAFLSSFTDYEQKHADQLRRASLDLDRVKRLAARLGNPERDFSSIHIAGSKGKGSTTWFVEHLARMHGLHTGRFISPHLETPLERIAINGNPVQEHQFLSLTKELLPLLDVDPPEPPSFFESITLMAFLEFAARSVDLAAVEVGLGGRLDSTNILLPCVSIITMIDLEHTRVLGETEELIAAEKAGIVKPNVPVVVGEDPRSPAGRVIEKYAADMNAPIFFIDREVSLEVQSQGRFSFQFDGHRLSDLRLGVRGRHQIRNAVMAVTALLLSGKIEANEEIIRSTLLESQLPGRLEDFPSQSGRLSWPLPVLLDCAHTEKSMMALHDEIGNFENQRRVLVVGFLRDKDIEVCLRPLANDFEWVIVVEPESPRAFPAEDLATTARSVFQDAEVMVEKNGLSAVDPEVLREFDLAVITGSTYLAGQARRLLGSPSPRKSGDVGEGD